MEKNPELAEAYAALVAQRDAVLAKTRPLEARAAKLHEAVDRALEAWRAVRVETVRIEEAGNLRDVSRKIAALARAMGARSMKAGSL